MNRVSIYRLVIMTAVLALLSLGLPTDLRAQSALSSMGAGAPKSMARNVDAHIQSLHDALQITPAEEPQWKLFAQVMRDNAAQMEQAFATRGAGLKTMNAVENLQSYSQIAQAQSAGMQKLAAAFETLYGTFPAAQQQVADGVFRAKTPKRARDKDDQAAPLPN